MRELEKRALGLLGLAARARRLTLGVPLTLAALKDAAPDKTPRVVIEASDTSENTHKRVCDRIKYYDVFHRQIAVSGEELATAVGKRGGTLGAVGVTEPHLAAAVIALWQEEKEQIN